MRRPTFYLKPSLSRPQEAAAHPLSSVNCEVDLYRSGSCIPCSILSIRNCSLRLDSHILDSSWNGSAIPTFHNRFHTGCNHVERMVAIYVKWVRICAMDWLFDLFYVYPIASKGSLFSIHWYSPMEIQLKFTETSLNHCRIQKNEARLLLT